MNSLRVEYYLWILAIVVVVSGLVHYIVLPLFRWLYFNGVKTLRELPGLLYNELIWVIYAFIRLIGPITAAIWIAYSIKTGEYEFTILAIAYGIAYIKFYSDWKEKV